MYDAAGTRVGQVWGTYTHDPHDLFHINLDCGLIREFYLRRWSHWGATGGSEAIVLGQSESRGPFDPPGAAQDQKQALMNF